MNDEAKMNEKLSEQEELTLESINVKCESLSEVVKQIGGYIDENLDGLYQDLRVRDSQVGQSFQMISAGIASIVGKIEAIVDYLATQGLDRDKLNEESNVKARAIMEAQAEQIKLALEKADKLEKGNPEDFNLKIEE